MPKRAWSFVVPVVVVFASACGIPEDVTFDDTEAQEQAIINGHKSGPAEFPSTGALLVRGTSAYGFDIEALCSGTLIAPDVVLTAAHCQYDEDDRDTVRYYFSFALDVTRAGQTLGTMPAHTYEVKAFIQHPEYRQTRADGLGHANDAALVFLQKAVKEVVPTPVLKTSESAVVRVGAPVEMVGYGVRTNPEDDPDAHDSGIKMEGKSIINEIGKYELQIGRGLPEAEKCYGDSGGPTFITTPRGMRVLGITSRLYDHRGFRKGTVDSRTDVLGNWIRRTMATACAEGRRVAGCDSQR